LNRNPDPSIHEIREGLSGNLCRCTGYAKIVETVQEAARILKEFHKNSGCTAEL